MYSLLPLIARRQKPRLRGSIQWWVQSSQSFFKMSFKSPQPRPTKATIKELSKKQVQSQSPTPQTMPQKAMPQQAMPEQDMPQPLDQPPPPDNKKKPIGTINSGIGTKIKHPSAITATQKPTIPNIADQRAKWMAKVSPEMQKKAKLAAAKGSAPASPAKMKNQNHQNSGFGQNFGGMPRNQNPWQSQNMGNMGNMGNQPLKKPEPDEAFKGASSEAQRKSWMSRMQGSQQKKQAQWLKDMQAKQQAGKELHAQKMQQMQQISKTNEAPSTPPPTSNQIAVLTTLQEPEPEEKSPEHLAYLDAIKQLNSYQALEPAAGRATSKGSKAEADPIIEQTLECLEKTGLRREQLKDIPVIQIAGSKGRGSTCGIVESILRCHGVKTGVLCSPHMFLTSERIRIDGDPLEETKFTELFWKIHNELATTKPTASYNKLMTVMAFHAFHQARVDVIIVEVGQLCASDATNIAYHAETIGITTLGWEQSSNLSNSLRDIAWAKAAIMKPHASIYTSVTQTECSEVLAQKANQLGLQLHRVPAFTDYMEGNLSNKHLMNKANYSMRLNGSLGIQLAYDYLRRHKPEYVVGLEHNSTSLTPGTTRGIELYEQPGQFDFIKHDMFNVYLDSADTFESMMACRDWFYTRTRSNRQPKVLLFNKVNEFNAKDLLTIVRSNLRFEEACFVPSPNFFEGEIMAEEEGNPMVWHGMEELQRAKRNAGNWRALCEENGKKDNSQLSISINAFFEHLLNKYGKQSYGMKNELDILVTGSRQLVAATLSCVRRMKAVHQWKPDRR
ncbi:folylpolyglutamate synthase, mitochondrial [Drosophila bipectinata]|uniref:folylpolyglutamate synthase, mitochondrial n=1 Tax=Drosophila bipectinata TaxID=42026 RepID=UPI001C89A434|nr:folylpolyglutamate synthase, mitochondrial [Drosophila bipectinata]